MICELIVIDPKFNMLSNVKLLVLKAPWMIFIQYKCVSTAITEFPKKIKIVYTFCASSLIKLCQCYPVLFIGIFFLDISLVNSEKIFNRLSTFRYIKFNCHGLSVLEGQLWGQTEHVYQHGEVL